VAGDGLFHVDEQAADDEIGHAEWVVVVWYAVGTMMNGGIAHWYCQVPFAGPPNRRMAEPDPLSTEHRSRLLEGMAHAVADKGYATPPSPTSCARPACRAAPSTSIFTKAECLVALYEAASHNALKVLRGAIDPAHDWAEQVEHALAPTCNCMAANPVLLRTLFVEILGLGPEGLAARRRVNQEIADFMLGVVNGGAAAGAAVAGAGDGGGRRHQRTGAAGIEQDAATAFL
jgi:hypothetical protein